MASPIELTSFAVLMKALPVATAAPVAAVSAPAMIADVVLIPLARDSPNAFPDFSPASFAAGSVVAPISVAIVFCEPSIEGTIVTYAFATSMCSPLAIGTLLKIPFPQFVRSQRILTDLADVLVLTRSWVRLKSWVLLSVRYEPHEMYIY